MKLLYLTNGYPPRQRAGTEAYTAGLAVAMLRAGHQVRVACAGDWDSGPARLNSVVEEVHEGVPVTRLNINWTQGPNPNRSLYDDPEIEAWLDQHLRADPPDVVHVTSCYTLSASVLRAIKRRQLPLVITLTDFWFLCPRVTLLRSDGTLCSGQTTAWECLQCLMAEAKAYRWPTRVLPSAWLEAPLTWASRQAWLSRRPGLRGMALDMHERKRSLPALLDLADVVIAPSRTLAQVYRENGVSRDIQVVEYGHALDWAAAVRRRPAAAPIVFGYVGRITPAKGVHVLAEAAGRLTDDVPLRIEIWGDSQQEPAYTASLPRQQPGTAPVVFRGAFGREALAEVYSQMDALVVPSLWYENNPLVVQEAFAAGLPVIASRLGGLAEFVTDGVNGLLVEPGNAAALAEALRRFAQDPGLQARLRAGIPAVKTIEQEVARLAALYAELVQPAPAVT